MSGKYSSAPALRAALDVRLLERARALGRDPNWIRRRLAFSHVFAVRRTHPVPEDLPPPPSAWAERYALLAAEIGQVLDSVEAAHEIVRRHWQQARNAPAA